VVFLKAYFEKIFVTFENLLKTTNFEKVGMEEESGISNDNIKVIVRIRPLNDKEKTMNGGICASTVNSDSNTLVMDSKPTPKTFSYDWVGDHSTP
jgi:hypothetical protein